MTELTKQIIELRNLGKTYNEIIKITGCSKANVSFVCSRFISNNTAITNGHIPTQIQRESMSLATTKYFKKLREERMNYWLKYLKDYYDQAFIHYISGLYDGEGNHTGSSFGICNSNPNIIKSIIKFFTSVIFITFRTTLRIHITQNQEECITFWKSHGITIDKVIQIDTRKQKRNNKYKENHGTICFYCKKALGLKLALNKYSYSNF